MQVEEASAYLQCSSVHFLPADLAVASAVVAAVVAAKNHHFLQGNQDEDRTLD